MRVRSTGLFLAFALLASAQASASICDDPVRVGPRSTDVISPIGSVADGVLDESLAEAARESDPLEAIAILQENQYTMTHPDAPADWRQTAYFQTRCGSRGRYERLDDAIAQQVLGLRDRYRKQGWYLGTARSQLTKGQTGETQPGILNLLLAANRYDDFEAEAERFLKLAIGDAQAEDYFQEVAIIADRRLRDLTQWENNYQTPYHEGGVGLLASERSGIEALKDFEQRLEPLRAGHVEHWLDAEQQSFDRLLSNLPKEQRLFELPLLQVETGVEQLQLALSVAREQDSARIRERARERGETLTERERHGMAVRYFEVAGDEQRIARAEAAAQRAVEDRVAGLKRTGEKMKLEMQKSEGEKAAFEAETDALADELGISLEDF